MRAVVLHGVGDIRLDNVAEPKIELPTDAIVRITTAAICAVPTCTSSVAPCRG